MREIREKDRKLNKDSYPALYYPEMYLLEGGYKCFFENHRELCLPPTYLPMLDDNHREDLKFFRKKSKTWDISSTRRQFKKTTRQLSFNFNNLQNL
jgi:M-phase inducer phosphatase 2